MIPRPRARRSEKPTMTNPYTSETGCCPRFVPEPSNETELQSNDKLFVRDRVPCLFYMPLNFGKVMTRVMARIAQAEAFTSSAPIALSDHTSRWNMDLYIEVSREIPNAQHTRLSGSFLSKVFEGPIQEHRPVVQPDEGVGAVQGQDRQTPPDVYTTCPKCAKHFGETTWSSWPRLRGCA